MSNESDDPLGEILIALRDEDAAVRKQAIWELQRHSYAVVDDTKNGEISDPVEIVKAFEALGEHRTQWLRQSRIVEALLLAIDDSTPRVRATAALLLGNIAELRAQESLIRHLRDDPNAHVRKMCAAALGWTPRSEQRFECFIDALKDSDADIVSLVCSYLGREGDLRAIEPLRVAMANPAWNVQFGACDALVDLHSVDTTVVRLLERLDGSPEAKQHNEIVVDANGFGEPEGTDKDLQAHTTERVLEQARRLLL